MDPTTPEWSQPSLYMCSGACYIPKPRKDSLLGQDAFFICEDKQTIGVADGVGGWDKKGIDSGIYSRNLMSNFVTALERYPTLENNQNIDLEKILKKAYSKTKDEGSSTACILTLKNNSLHCVNVGDSGFLLLRNGDVLFKSPAQTKGFNCPYQLGKSRDTPSAAQVSCLRVQAGDIVVLGTDGLHDNLFTDDIKDIVNFTAGAGPDLMARVIAAHACQNSNDSSAHTPFSEECFNRQIKWGGGKKDDISVVVAFIIDAELVFECAAAAAANVLCEDCVCAD